MFCKNCGKEIHDEAVICVHCGVSTGNPMTRTSDLEDEPANGGLVFLSILIPLCGIILGATNISAGKKHAGKVYLWSAIITLLVSSVMCGVIWGIVAANAF